MKGIIIAASSGPAENSAGKFRMAEIGVYLAMIGIVTFAVHKASIDISNAGKRTTEHTLNSKAVKAELAKLTEPDVALETYLKTVNLLIRHGRIQEAQTLIIKRLKHLKANESQKAVSPAIKLEEIALLKALAVSNIKAMKFTEAQLIYKEAAGIAKKFGNWEEQILISSDLVDLYAQYAKLASSDIQRKEAEEYFNAEVEQLNTLVAGHPPDTETQRLIHNRYRVGLIEMNRFLELDNFDPEPQRHGRI